MLTCRVSKTMIWIPAWGYIISSCINHPFINRESDHVRTDHVPNDQRALNSRPTTTCRTEHVEYSSNDVTSRPLREGSMTCRRWSDQPREPPLGCRNEPRFFGLLSVHCILTEHRPMVATVAGGLRKPWETRTPHPWVMRSCGRNSYCIHPPKQFPLSRASQQQSLCVCLWSLVFEPWIWTQHRGWVQKKPKENEWKWFKVTTI